MLLWSSMNSCRSLEVVQLQSIFCLVTEGLVFCVSFCYVMLLFGYLFPYFHYLVQTAKGFGF